MRNVYYAIIATLLLLTTTSCYRERLQTLNGSEDDTLVIDSSRHYSIGYNFIVKGDSIILISQQPEEHVSQLETDSFSIRHNRHLAVTDINILPQDSIDSVWVQVVSDQGRLGWIHERQLLNNVVPTDPISQFIMFLPNDSPTTFFLSILFPHYSLLFFDSFYPSLLCIIVACSATFYASLQMFGADTWQHFYYHPSVNPFIMPPILGIFISSIWAMLIVGIATIDDVRHKLPLEDAILYLFGLIGVCSMLYIVFSISTLYYIGYPLLIAYCYYAITKYFKPNEEA